MAGTIPPDHSARKGRSLARRRHSAATDGIRAIRGQQGGAARSLVPAAIDEHTGTAAPTPLHARELAGARAVGCDRTTATRGSTEGPSLDERATPTGGVGLRARSPRVVTSMTECDADPHALALDDNQSGSWRASWRAYRRAAHLAGVQRFSRPHLEASPHHEFAAHTSRPPELRLAPSGRGSPTSNSKARFLLFAG